MNQSTNVSIPADVAAPAWIRLWIRLLVNCTIFVWRTFRFWREFLLKKLYLEMKHSPKGWEKYQEDCPLKAAKIRELCLPDSPLIFMSPHSNVVVVAAALIGDLVDDAIDNWIQFQNLEDLSLDCGDVYSEIQKSQAGWGKFKQVFPLKATEIRRLGLLVNPKISFP